MSGGLYLRYLQKSSSQTWRFHLQQSFWYAGLLLASFGYTCFLGEIDGVDRVTTAATFRWGLLWLAAPAMLTLIAKRTYSIRQRRLAVSLSCIGLVAAQLLVLGQPETRFVALSVAIALMFVNAFLFRRTVVTVIHFGFGLGLIASLLYSLVSTDYVSDWNWLPIGGLTVLGLYKLQQRLQQQIEKPTYNYISERTAFGVLGVGTETQNSKLINKYLQAIDYWAIAIIGIATTILSALYLTSLNLNDSIYWAYLLTPILLACGLVLRYARQPNHWAAYTQTWLWGIAAVALTMLLGTQ